MRSLVLALCLLPSVAFGQSAVQQNGAIVQYNLPRWNQDHRIEDAGGLLGKNGQGVNPFAIYDRNSLALCADNALTTGPYNALCFGHDAQGNGVISLDSNNGAADTSLIFEINGASYPFGTALTTGMQVMPDNASMLATPSTYASWLVRGDFVAGRGVPPMIYKSSNSACTLNGGAGDNGSQIRSSDAKCWIASFSAGGADFRQWGAAAGADVTAALTAAIAWTCTSHIPVLIPYTTNQYQLSSQIVLGNGSAVANSTCNNITVTGTQQGTEFGGGNPVAFSWTGASGIIPFLVRGPALSINLINVGVDCNNICSSGFRIVNTLDSEYGGLGVRRQVNGPAFIYTSEPVNIWLGGFENNWVHDNVAAKPGAGGSGAQIGDIVCGTCSAAVIANKFDNNAWLYDGTTAGTFGIKLGFAVQSVFTQTRTQKVDAIGALGTAIVIAPPPGGTGFPTDLTFYHTVADTNITATGWTANKGIHFDSWVTGYTPFPTSSTYGLFWGTDEAGNYYPGTQTWVITDTSGATLALTTAEVRLFKIGKQCTISFDVVYPTTASGLAAQLGTVPTYCIPAGAAAVAGGHASYNNVGTPVIVLVDNSGHISFYNGASAYTNVGLTGKEIRGTFTWITN